jgi:Ser/Thr protein kinase RdoA (MazF antagonist)
MAKLFADLQIGTQWKLTGEEIITIANTYELHNVRAERKVFSGAVNGVALIHSQEGSWVLRVHRPWTTPARLSGVHAALEALRIDAHPVPRVRETTTGTTFTTLADRLVEVVEYIPSDATANTWERTSCACAVLGKLHSTLAQLPPGFLPPPAYSTYATPETLRRMIQETNDDFATHSRQPMYQRATLIREQVHSLIETLTNMRQRYETRLLPGYAHGDFGGDNVLIAGGSIVAILDFDFMAYSERIFDLAYVLYWALYRFCERQDRAIISRKCISKASSALADYNRHAPLPLNAEEGRALPWEMARIPLFWIAEAGYLGTSAEDGAAIEQTLRFAEHVTIARQLIDNAALLGQIFQQTLN